MKKYLQLIVLISCIGYFVFISCQKEISRGGSNRQKPPISNAGPDQVITLPTDSILLDGRSSSDPDGRISGWLWKKISGPASFNINRSADSITVVNNLTAGIYQFELEVTDNVGLTAKDTTQVIVDTVVVTNHSPIANAGPDQTIMLPENTVTLKGSASTDPDNNIIAYLWTKISGPSSFNILNPNSVQTQVNNLIQGAYQFELKVIDGTGLYSQDTMDVIVAENSCGAVTRVPINLQLISLGSLSLDRNDATLAAVGTKLLIAGGNDINSRTSTSRVDIYDINTNMYSTAELSESKSRMNSITVGNKVFFVGGVKFQNGGNTGNALNIDVYDLSTNSWTVLNLNGNSIAAFPALASVGSKIFFSNSELAISNRVDIYDISSNNWSTAFLSQARQGVAISPIGDKVYFSGGRIGDNYSSIIDIYDNITNTWSVTSLIEAKAYHSQIFLNNKIFWAGGSIGFDTLYESDIHTCKIEIRDINRGETSIEHLTSPNIYFNRQKWTTVNQNMILFRYPNDILDVTNHIWYKFVIPQNVGFDHFVTVGNETYGLEYGAMNKLWKLIF